MPEAWGGDTIVVEMSATQDLGIDDLLDQLLVVAELEELTANPDGRAKGVVLEANLDIGRGPVATVLVDKGALKVGDPIVAGAAWGTVRAMIDDHGEQIKAAGPSTPVQVLGLSTVPAGRRRVPRRSGREGGPHGRRGPRAPPADASRSAATPGSRRAPSSRTSSTRSSRGETATLNLILKADVHGLARGGHREPAQARPPGGRADVRAPRRRRHHRERHHAGRHDERHDHRLQRAPGPQGPRAGRRRRTSRSGPTRSSTSCSRTSSRRWSACSSRSSRRSSPARPRSARSSGCPRIGAIAGCYVRTGVITRGSKVRFLRDGTIIWKGAITSLKRFKDDAREVREGFECGIGLSDFQDLKSSPRTTAWIAPSAPRSRPDRGRRRRPSTARRPTDGTPSDSA